MSNKELVLRAEIERCFSDWGEDFDVDIEEEDGYVGFTYFSVIIKHSFLGDDYEFSARVKGVNCDMDYSEDCWQPLNMGNMFAWMWFEEARRNQ